MMRYIIIPFFIVAMFFASSPLFAATTPVAEVSRALELDRRAEMVDGWLDKARAFRFVEVVLRVNNNNEKKPYPQELVQIIKSYIAKFMTKDEVDALFREVRGYYKKVEKTTEGVSLEIKKEIFYIDIIR